jgi:acyl-CoA reductase-like NAD-dependent aldehyde dehydrogenase
LDWLLQKKITHCTLELGGKSANIFFDDFDFNMAIDGACLGILLNKGQVCIAGSRIFVQDTFYDKFVDALIKQFNSVNVGNSLDPNTMMGAQVNAKHLKKILDYVKLGESEGCKIGCGGIQVKDNGLDKGCYMRPTLLLNATNKMRVSQEEIFGPVAVVIKFHDVDEVIKMANDYGMIFAAPPMNLCTDNGAMIAWAGIENWRIGNIVREPVAPRPRWPLTEL